MICIGCIGLCRPLARAIQQTRPTGQLDASFARFLEWHNRPTDGCAREDGWADTMTHLKTDQLTDRSSGIGQDLRRESEPSEKTPYVFPYAPFLKKSFPLFQTISLRLTIRIVGVNTESFL